MNGWCRCICIFQQTVCYWTHGCKKILFFYNLATNLGRCYEGQFTCSEQHDFRLSSFFFHLLNIFILVRFFNIECNKYRNIKLAAAQLNI